MTVVAEMLAAVSFVLVAILCCRLAKPSSSVLQTILPFYRTTATNLDVRLMKYIILLQQLGPCLGVRCMEGGGLAECMFCDGIICQLGSIYLAMHDMSP